MRPITEPDFIHLRLYGSRLFIGPVERTTYVHMPDATSILLGFSSI
jgi:hypothetical protein